MPENINIEYKENWNEEHLKQICSFANANGGVLFIGINDKGDITGIHNFKKLMDDLPNIIQAKLGIFAEVELLESDKKYYIKISVNPSSMAISLRGTYYQRTGTTTKELTGNALTEFLLKRSGLSWGDVVEERASFDDINESSVKTYKADAEKSGRIPDVITLTTTDLFEKLHLIDNGKLKRAAIILFGKDPEKYYPQSHVKIGRFVSNDSSPKFHEIIEGNLITLQKRVFEIIETKFMVKNISYDGVHRIETPEYPFAALREAIMNALIHRDYMGSMTQIRINDDSFQIWNDGPLVDGLTIEQLKQNHPSKPRNKLIAEVCLKGGYIEAWGTGIPRIINACRMANLPAPTIEETSGGFQITITNISESALIKLGLNERQIKAYQYVRTHGKITNAIYQKLNNIGKTFSTKELYELVSLGLLKHSGTGRGSIYTFY